MIEEIELYYEFNAADINPKDKRLSLDEWVLSQNSSYFKSRVPLSYADLFKRVDVDKDRFIDFNQFKLMRKVID